jgi:ABC-2 type transport system ATP-binding protein
VILRRQEVTDAAIVAESLSYTLPGRVRPLLRDISFRIGEGSVVAITGPNGSGKTILLRLLAGLLSPTGGRIIVSGLDMTREPDSVKGIVGLMTEEPFLPGRLTVLWHIVFHALLRGAPWRDAWGRAEEILEDLGLSLNAGTPCGALSRGTRQRVALARVLVGRPRVLLLDEPGSGLDAASAATLWRLLRLHSRGGGIVILATHAQAEISILSDGVIRLKAPGS